MQEEKIIPNITDFHIPRWEEFPNIDLYVDQVITLLNTSLSNYVQKEKDGSILTQTMINNYVKHDIIPATHKKKYNKEHIASLFVICILKQVFSINDIARLIEISIKKTSIDIAYDRFCEELEDTVKAVFEGRAYAFDDDLASDSYALQTALRAFASKLYIDKIYLKKF